MDNKQQQEILKGTFDAVASAYDSQALRFFPAASRHLAQLLDLRGDEHVLDVATGTGNAALAIAGRLPQGRVTGVDFSEGMLKQARRKAAELKIPNTEFLEMDMQSLVEMEAAYDAAVCAFGIFFVEDMGAQLELFAATVRPGGVVAITGFAEDYFQPLARLMFERLESYGVAKPPQTWKSIASEAGCERLFRQAGLENIRVEQKNLGYHLTSADQWWDVIWNGGLRRLVSQLPPADLERFKREHLVEIEALKTDEGIWLDVGVLFTIGTKP